MAPSGEARHRDCDPARPLPAADQPQTFAFGGTERTYVLALPPDYDGTTASPLLFDFHGYGSSAETHDRTTRLAEKGTARGYVVVTPEALGQPREWNMFGVRSRADDFGFVDALIVDLSERLCLDEARIYAAGHSNGSAFAGFLQCREPYRFAAVAMVAAFVPAGCPADRVAPAVVAIHGTADPGVPYYGGTVAAGPVVIPAVLETLAGYADAYSCDEPPTIDRPAPQVVRRSYTGCVHDSEITLYTVIDGSHDWPGGQLTPAAQPVPGGQDFPASDAILDFFDRHPPHPPRFPSASPRGRGLAPWPVGTLRQRVPTAAAAADPVIPADSD